MSTTKKQADEAFDDLIRNLKIVRDDLKAEIKKRELILKRIDRMLDVETAKKKAPAARKKDEKPSEETLGKVFEGIKKIAMASVEVQGRPGAFTVKQLAEASGVSEGTARNAINNIPMVKQVDMITRAGRGTPVYAAVSDPDELLPVTDPRD